MADISRAFLSVSDKSGLKKLAEALAEEDVELIATGGTAVHLEQAGHKVTPVAEITGYPELLGGRVKSFHPAIFAGLLATEKKEDLVELEEQQIEPVDLVVCNLYPFKETVEDNPGDIDSAVEQIDIGGPSLIRAAAKNHQRVTVLTAPEQYDEFSERLGSGELNLQYRQRLAGEAFKLTAEYDGQIASYFAGLTKQKEETNAELNLFPEHISIKGDHRVELKYGENPHQQSSAYLTTNSGLVRNQGQSILLGELQAGEELSYNNINDAAAALELVREFSGQPAAALIKHTNPCGLAISDSPVVAFRRAHAGDPESAYGSIAALNKQVDAALSREITGGRKFIEVIVAPSFTTEAVESLTERWSEIKLLAVGEFSELPESRLEFRSLPGGFLLQETDDIKLSRDNFKPVTEAEPGESEIEDLLFAWKAVKHVKSNAIVLARDNALVGVGAGQMSRIDAVRLAGRKASGRQRGGVMASDAFFPFPDAVEEVVRLGIKAIIQPGGSIRDESVIKACNKSDIKMVFTGRRHFKH